MRTPGFTVQADGRSQAETCKRQWKKSVFGGEVDINRPVNHAGHAMTNGDAEHADDEDEDDDADIAEMDEDA